MKGGRGFRKVGQVLPTAIGHEEALRAAKAQAILRDWESIVGEGLAKRSRPDRYGKGVVWVAVTGSAWAQEMRMRKETILARLRERGGDHSLFMDIRFGVRPVLPPAAPVPERVPESLPRTLEEMSIRQIAERRRSMWK